MLRVLKASVSEIPRASLIVFALAELGKLGALGTRVRKTMKSFIYNWRVKRASIVASKLHL